MEDVALTVSWMDTADSSQVNLYGDKRQENRGSLTSLGKTDGHWFLLRSPGFPLYIKDSTRLLEAVWIMFSIGTAISESQLLTGYVTSLLILLSLAFPVPSLCCSMWDP